MIAVVSGLFCYKMVWKGNTQTQNDSPRYQGTLNNAHKEGADPFYSLLGSTGGVTQPTPLTSVREEQVHECMCITYIQPPKLYSCNYLWLVITSFMQSTGMKYVPALTCMTRFAT